MRDKEDERMYYIRLMTEDEFWESIDRLPPFCPNEAEEIARNLANVKFNPIFRAGPIMSDGHFPYFARSCENLAKPRIDEIPGSKIIVRLDEGNIYEPGLVNVLPLEGKPFNTEEAWAYSFSHIFFVRDWRCYCRCRIDGSFLRPIIPHWDGDPGAIADIDF